MICTPDAALPPVCHCSRAVRRRRVWLGLLVLAWGMQAIVTQSLLLREALVLMFGSEFAWGIVLFAWLFGVSIGAVGGGWIAPRLRRVDVALVVVLLTLSAAACVELWVFRGARAWLGVGAGELLPLPKTALAAMLFISPTSALVGLAFPLACCIADSGRADDGGESVVWQGGEIGISPQQGISPQRTQQHVQQGSGPLGVVYALESLGSLIGGAVFSFWAVEHLAPIETALICGAITAAASAGFLAATGHNRPVVASLAALGIAALLVSVFAGDALNHRLVLRRWQNVARGYDLCAEAESKYQNLAVGRRADQFSLYCNGHVTADFPDPYTFVPLAHAWMCRHPAPRRVLVLGGGAEGLLAEILRHPIERVDYVEPDPRQIELIEPYLTDADRQALRDARVTVHHLDARYFIKTQRDRFDLVIARLPEPTSALHARFYTDEFYRELRRAMTPRSVLCMTVAATPADLPVASANYVASIRATLRRHFSHIIIGWGNPAQVLAATDDGLISIDPDELAGRYSRCGVQLRYFSPLMFGATDAFEPDKLQARAEQLDAAGGVEICTDLRPAIYMQRLALWEQMTGGRAWRVIQSLRSVDMLRLVSALVMIAAVTLIACRLRSGSRNGPRPTDHDPWASGAILLSVGTTGFVTMALSIIWLFAFQNLYGYVYSRIGWIIALFMGGLVVGCWVISRRSKRVPCKKSQNDKKSKSQNLQSVIPNPQSLNPRTLESSLTSYLWHRLIAVDVLLALLSLSVPFVLPVLGGLQDTRLAFVLVEVAVSIMVALTGVLGGAAFALAGGLQLAVRGEPGSAAGSVDGADHAGACAGALLTGILLVPVFGTAAAAFLLVGIKLGSAVLLVSVRRLSRAA